MAQYAASGIPSSSQSFGLQRGALPLPWDTPQVVNVLDNAVRAPTQLPAWNHAPSINPPNQAAQGQLPPIELHSLGRSPEPSPPWVLRPAESHDTPPIATVSHAALGKQVASSRVQRRNHAMQGKTVQPAPLRGENMDWLGEVNPYILSCALYSLMSGRMSVLQTSVVVARYWQSRNKANLHTHRELRLLRTNQWRNPGTTPSRWTLW